MLQKETVFVIGAGSGSDIDMPLGSTLLSTIQRYADFKMDRHSIVRTPDALASAIFDEVDSNNPNYISQRKESNDLLQICRKISAASRLTNSIDDYVYQNSGNNELVRIAKLHIAYVILEKEGLSSLKLKNSISSDSDIQGMNDTWLFDFFKLLAQPSLSKNPDDFMKNVSIISFNYDRCLEQFLYSALPICYDIKADDAVTIIESANIIHPYGQVGKLPMFSAQMRPVKFGDISHRSNVIDAADEIKTYTEQLNTEMAERIKETIAKAEHIIFLGFGFHKQNVDMLSSPKNRQGYAKIFGTTVGESAQNVSMYRSRLIPLIGADANEAVDINFQNLNCKSFIQNNREDFMR